MVSSEFRCCTVCVQIILLMQLSLLASPLVQPWETKIYQGHSYYYSSHDFKKPWYGARDVCINMNADLASISDMFENKFLISNMRPSDKFWIGLVYNSKLGRQVWTDGQLFSFGQLSYTYPWEPAISNSSKGSQSEKSRIFNPQAAAASLTECTHIFKMKWSKRLPCSREFRFVCKKKGIYRSPPPIDLATTSKMTTDKVVKVKTDTKSGQVPANPVHHAQSTLTLVMAVLVVVVLLAIALGGAFWVYRRHQYGNRSGVGRSGAIRRPLGTWAENRAVYNSDTAVSTTVVEEGRQN